MSEREADLSSPSWCFSSDGVSRQAQEPPRSVMSTFFSASALAANARLRSIRRKRRMVFHESPSVPSVSVEHFARDDEYIEAPGFLSRWRPAACAPRALSRDSSVAHPTGHQQRPSAYPVEPIKACGSSGEEIGPFHPA